MMNTKLDYIFDIEDPWIYFGKGEIARKKWIPSYFYNRPGLNTCVRQLRGNKMRTTQSLMDEFSAAFQFPDAFGENWYALEELLCYLDEWLPASAYVIVIEKSEELLRDASDDDVAALFNVLNAAGEWWSRPIVDNDRFNRPSIPFHALLHFSNKSDVEGRMLKIVKQLDIKVNVQANQ